MQQAIVTGAGGFTGSNLCRILVQHGCHVKAMIRPDAPMDRLNGLDVQVIRGDIGRPETMHTADFDKVDTVFHIAAMYRQEGANRDAFRDINVNGTRHVLEKATKAGVKRFIHCSTAGVHGWIDYDTPAQENAPFRPGDWYQETKLEGEQLVKDWGHRHGLPFTIIRPTAICGPGDTRFLKLFRAINRRRFIMIGKGTHHYHFVHVDDLAQGFIKAAENEKASGEVFILAGPESISLNTIVRYIAEILNVPPPRMRIPVFPVTIAAHLCDAVCKRIGITPPLYPRRVDFFTKHRSYDDSKARERLHYLPRITPYEALSQMGDWYREHHLL